MNVPESDTELWGSPSFSLMAGLPSPSGVDSHSSTDFVPGPALF